MQNNQSDMHNGLERQRAEGVSSDHSETQVSLGTLRKMAARAGQRYSIELTNSHVAENIIEMEAVMKGQVIIQEAGPALTVHTTDAIAERDWIVEIDLPAGLIFCFLDEGDLNFTLDEQDYCFQALTDSSQDNCQASNNCFLLSLEKPARLKRCVVAGLKTKKLNITASQAWVRRYLFSHEPDNKCVSRALSLGHGEFLRWPAGLSLTQAAQQLFRYSQQGNSPSEGNMLLADNLPLGSLLLQGQATQCLALALNDSLELAQHRYYRKPKVRELEWRLMAIIERYVDSSSDSTEVMLTGTLAPMPLLNVGNIANELGMSVSAVQRLAKQVLGDSLVNYIRGQKLGIARKALEAGKMSIGEIAYQAGYKHSSNFAIAFKKAFGFAPGALQKYLKQQPV